MPWRHAPISGIYTMVLVEIITGLVMFNWLRHSPILTPLVGWIPRLMNIQNIRLIHFGLMFVFIAFGIFHVHLCLIVSAPRNAACSTAFSPATRIIPVDELEEDDRKAIAASKGKTHRAVSLRRSSLGWAIWFMPTTGSAFTRSTRCSAIPVFRPESCCSMAARRGLALLHHISGVRRLAGDRCDRRR